MWDLREYSSMVRGGQRADINESSPVQAKVYREKRGIKRKGWVGMKPMIGWE